MITKEDLKPGYVILISDERGDSLFEVMNEDDSPYMAKYLEEGFVAARCFFGSRIGNNYWLDFKYITEVFKR